MRDESTRRVMRGLLAVLALLPLSLLSGGTSRAQQDPTFRLMSIERRLDQMQMRLDSLERAALTSTPGGGGSIGDSSAVQLTIELQRQLLALAEQQVIMQRQMLEMQKRIDLIAEKQIGDGRPAGAKKGEEAVPAIRPSVPKRP